jgi:hypothetical protein
MPCSNNAAACRRTCPRRARPEAVRPPPSGYLRTLVSDPHQGKITPTRRWSPDQTCDARVPRHHHSTASQLASNARHAVPFRAPPAGSSPDQANELAATTAAVFPTVRDYRRWLQEQLTERVDDVSQCVCLPYRADYEQCERRQRQQADPLHTSDVSLASVLRVDGVGEQPVPA